MNDDRNYPWIVQAYPTSEIKCVLYDAKEDSLYTTPACLVLVEVPLDCGKEQGLRTARNLLYVPLNREGWYEDPYDHDSKMIGVISASQDLIRSEWEPEIKKRRGEYWGD